ncbi:hypothetical protein HAX54_047764 [Datura stramonium]|uniref:Uncharacterized protein n=1 Tax=Datura stramonium TaxID=4076 RepID=A0ABS8STJ2_DATST|nr:hypothetical protein [Datura stramonium]
MQHDDEKVIQNMDFSMGGFLQELQSSHLEEKLDQLEIDAEIEKVTLELQRKIHQINIEDSSESEMEDVKKEACFKMERLRPHSNNFSALYLVNDMKIEATESMEDFG